MASIQDVIAWVERDLSRFGKVRDHVNCVTTSSTHAPTELSITIYTDIHRYVIRAHDAPQREPDPPGAGRDHDGSYLGCSASGRKTRAGEDWHRGSDLADGMLCDWTWHRILSDIVSYEMVKIHRPDPMPAVPAPSYDGPAAR